MSIFLHATRLALPAMFFGYGVFANLSLLTGPLPAVALPDDGLLSGGLTQDLDRIYKKDLPHMRVSIGLIGAARYALLGETRLGAVAGTDGWLFTAEELRAQPSDRQLAAIVRTVADVRARLALRGVDLIVIPLPAKIDIYRKHGPDPVFGNALQSLYSQFIAQLATLDIRVVDTRSALLDAAAPVFFATDTHWTPQGAAIVADAVAASGNISPGNLIYKVTTAAPKALTGDLVSFVSTTELAPYIGLPQESVAIHPQTAVVAGADSDIFGATGQDIVLVGTSYSANPDWGFADALMRTLGRDVVSVAQQGLGPLQPMQQYLASPDYRDAPPKVVIWEIPIRYLTDPALWPAAVLPDLSARALAPKEDPNG